MGRVGLVLGAGGAVGHAYHAGTLAGLHAATGWDARRADVVVGTSAGSVVAAMLRAGVGPGDLFARAVGAPLSAEASRLFSGMAWPRLGPKDAQGPRTWAPLGDPARLLARAAWSPGATSPGAVLAAALPAGRIPNDALASAVRHIHRAGGGSWPQQDTWVCAVRVPDGRRVVFGRDSEAVPSSSARSGPGDGRRSPAGSPTVDLGRAVAASCAIPAYYRPVEIGGADHVDGGVHSPTNADLVGDLDLDVVVVSSPMSGVGGPRLPLGVEGQMRALFAAGLRRELAGVRRRGVVVLAFEPTAQDQQAMGPDPMDASRRERTARQAMGSALERLARVDLAAGVEALSRAR